MWTYLVQHKDREIVILMMLCCTYSTYYTDNRKKNSKQYRLDYVLLLVIGYHGIGQGR